MNHLSARLEEVLLSGNWVAGTNILKEIESLPFEDATLSTSGVNSISNLVYHLTYYLKGMLVVLNENKLEMHDSESFNMPIMKTNEDWQKLIENFQIAANSLISKVEELNDIQLNKPFVDPGYGSLERNLEAQIEHSYYHLGQIVLIKKLHNITS